MSTADRLVSFTSCEVERLIHELIRVAALRDPGITDPQVAREWIRRERKRRDAVLGACPKPLTIASPSSQGIRPARRPRNPFPR